MVVKKYKEKPGIGRRNIFHLITWNQWAFGYSLFVRSVTFCRQALGVVKALSHWKNRFHTPKELHCLLPILQLSPYWSPSSTLYTQSTSSEDSAKPNRSRSSYNFMYLLQKEWSTVKLHYKCALQKGVKQPPSKKTSQYVICLIHWF